jgi:N-acetylglucosamine kinase
MLAEMGPAADGKAVTLLRWHQTRTHLRSEVAALARIVDALAERGESVAMGLMRRAADQLCLHVDAARRRIGEADSAWSHAGSVFASATIRQAMTARLGPPTPPALPPIGGALWRAARLAGWNPDSAWIARLAAALATHSDPEKQART